MANSKYEYVRSFEQPDPILPNTWMVVRIDGRGFSKLTAKYQFAKPNDRRALDLMNAAAEAVMKELPDLVLAYGNSDEFSFVFHKDCVLFERRASKLTTTIVSTFTSYYTFLWSTYFPDAPLTPPLPSFDGRAVCYPSDQNLRDYMSWRQVDCHINNLYNTTFWALVLQGGIEAKAAEKELSGTVSSDKNEILFSRFGINYNNEPEMFKKGSVLYRDFFPTSTQSTPIPSREVDSPTPIAHPQPRRSLARPMSQPLERIVPDLMRDSPLSAESTPRGPTFLSTSTTPSPPPSPPAMSIPAFPVPQTFIPIDPPPPNGNGSSSTGSKHLPNLRPLPLPPPTLKPSTKPPPSLSPPNPTAHTNTSPQPSPLPAGPIPHRSTSNSSRPASHSASASLTLNAARPSTAAGPSRPGLKQRSPSLSALDNQQPPVIPLRISSIPVNTKPRKLSLQSQKSLGMMRSEEKENFILGAGAGIGKSRSSPPLMTMKELPSPPTGSEKTGGEKGKEKDFALDPAQNNWKKPNWAMPEKEQDMSHGEMDPMILNTDTTPTRPKPSSKARPRSASHSRLHSAPSSSTSYFQGPSAKPSRSKSPLMPSSSQTHKANSSKAKSKITEEGGWAAGTKFVEGRPKDMSKTAREKDRKMRRKARIVIEHVDIIKDEFWERRPWILSGRAG